MALTAAALAAEPAWDSTAKTGWPAPFEKVSIPSTADGAAQPAYVYKATGEQPRPLVVSLHTWSGGYSQVDPLAALVQKKNWNYIHPDFRGPNTTPASCASKLALQDVDDAIAYALANMPVDKENIFVVGTSGGGHMACATYLNTRHPVKMTFAWVPITDLEAWYHQSKERRHKYADHILAVTQSQETLNVEDARARSPMFMPIPADLNAPIRIFAGIDDGYKGSVPITHSLLFYNRLAKFSGGENLVSESDIAALAAREKPADPSALPSLGKHKVLYHRASKLASVTIFQGGHEMVVDSCFAQMEELADNPAR
jgi:acetyl esterase/lipase